MSKSPAVVVITGASSGVGRATALQFASRRAHLVLASRNGAAIDEVAELCRDAGAEAISVTTDVTDSDAVHRLANAAVEKFGRIDVWVNNASVSVYGSFLDLPLTDFRQVLDVNILGYTYGAHAVLPVMIAQRSGVIVNVSSILGEIPQPYSAPYGMAKAAVRALGSTLRSELALAKHKGVHVATVLPPTLDTPFFSHPANYTGRKVVAMPPVYSPELVAKAIVKLAKHPKPEVVIGSIGKALVRQHRVSPVAVEAQLALQTEKLQFSRKEDATDTTGNLYEPSRRSEATVTGGWHGSEKGAVRRVLRAVLLVVGGGLLVRWLLA
ncbi:SDR family oxidoreductase [Marisediminicola senii]|uniref:SDR family oxidoreductase n=1 Tax=Marisediminicola senii TaxID=2711233 RepID=UPI0013EDFF98|nr:SDR family oxidoreductase [Marisediminicola senii]